MPGSGSSRRSLAIVGGTYVEKCLWPQSSEVFGSGLRAACALSGRGAPVVLHTYAADKERIFLDGIGAALGFTSEANRSPGRVTFEYQHPLARPFFSVSDRGVYELDPLHVEEESILSYGMIEGDPVVTGDRVVYDPQSPDDAAPFDHNGSRAKHLAIVANQSEARKLSQENDIEAAGNKLLENAEVVVIKSGPAGALLFTGDQISHIPSYRTERSFLIGSGDIFSAAFAYAWAVQRESPEAAAQIASLSTAFYCQTATVPIPTALPRGFHNGPVPTDKKARIYLAGPFFSPQQLWLVEEARSCLTELGAEVFSPFHDVGLGPEHIVAPADLEGLTQCTGVLALLDGFDPGTVFEVGYARAREIPVTAFVSSKEQVNLTMFLGSGCNVVHDFASAIYTAVWS